MSGIGAISPSTAIRIVRPVRQTGDAGYHGRDEAFTARQAYATAGTRPNSKRPTGDYSPFRAQEFANDNGASASSAAGAIAYLVTRHRLTDLPIGFLIAKAV